MMPAAKNFGVDAVKFIVDVMLGRLARWLRILGYDTLYDSHFTDDDLFFKAHQEKRILLTRDGDLARRMNPDFCFFISENFVRDQVKKVVKQFNLNIEDYIFTRCTLCNNLIREIPKKQADGRVPAFVYHSVGKFYYCDRCDKIYWSGSHIKLARELLSQLSIGENHD